MHLFQQQLTHGVGDLGVQVLIHLRVGFITGHLIRLKLIVEGIMEQGCPEIMTMDLLELMVDPAHLCLIHHGIILVTVITVPEKEVQCQGDHIRTERGAGLMMMIGVSHTTHLHIHH